MFDWAVNENEARPVWLAGFSFGGAMAVRAATERPAAGLVSVAPAIRRFASTLERRPECPWLIIQGDRDELVDVKDTQDYVESLDTQPQLEVLRDAEHFFHGRLVELRNLVETFVGEAVA